VTGVGGTEFYNDTTTGANAYWSGSDNSATQGSALSYIPEMVWNDTATAGELSAGGGGASIFFTKPVWQTGTGVPNDDARDVPDLAIGASPDHDPYLICSSDYTNQDTGVTDCTSGFRASDQTLDVVGGSSIGPPTFSGIVALIVQKTGSAQGNINEILCRLAAAAAGAFHDIANGNNQEPCQAGSIDCPNGGQIGFVAGPGYDQASGLGSIEAFNLVSKWTSVKPHTGATPDFALSSSPATLTVAAGASTSATLTVVPNNGFTGSVSVACSMPSTLSGVTCSLSPTTLGSTGTTSLSVAASTSAGVHGVTRFFTPGWPQALLLLAFSLIFGAAGLGAVKPRWTLRAANTLPRFAWLAIMIACLLAASVSCGGGGSTSTTTTTTTTTPSETGSVSVTATSGSLSHTVQVGVTVD
jgi:subtilase family serine protease